MGDRTVFDIHGVDYYPDITPDELPELYNQGYHILLLDFGSFNECCINEFLRCDRKLVIGSLAPWNIRQYRELLESISHYTNLGEGFYCLTRTESPKQKQCSIHSGSILYKERTLFHSAGIYLLKSFCTKHFFNISHNCNQRISFWEQRTLIRFVIQ